MLNAQEARDCSSKAGISVILYNLILNAIAKEEFSLTIEKSEITNKEIMCLKNLGYWITEVDEFNIRITW